MRRCLARGEVLPKDGLIRFVVGPERRIVPDVAGTLPGRGFWVSADRADLTKVSAKGLFARAARGKVAAAPDLADQVERLLAARALQTLGLARKSGELVLGFDSVEIALTGRKPVAVLIAASDGAWDGRRKLAAKRGTAILVDLLTSAEMGLALGRENVIHAALKPGGLAVRFLGDIGRLAGFRAKTADPTAASPVVLSDRTVDTERSV